MADEDDKAEDEPTEEGENEDGEKKKGGKKKLLLFIVLPAVLVLLLGTVGALMLMGGGKKDDAEQTASAEHGEDGGHGEGKSEKKKKGGEHAEAEPVFYELDDIFANIANEDGSTSILQLKILLEVDSEETVAAIEPLMPRIIDRYQAFLRELRIEDLKGSAGSYRLRLELLRRVNQAVAPAHVNAVLIDKLLVN